MKRLQQVKNLKKFRLFTKPITPRDISADIAEDFEDRWLLKAEKIETKRLRAWRQQLAR